MTVLKQESAPKLHYQKAGEYVFAPHYTLSDPQRAFGCERADPNLLDGVFPLLDVNRKAGITSITGIITEDKRSMLGKLLPGEIVTYNENGLDAYGIRDLRGRLQEAQEAFDLLFPEHPALPQVELYTVKRTGGLLLDHELPEGIGQVPQLISAGKKNQLQRDIKDDQLRNDIETLLTRAEVEDSIIRPMLIARQRNLLPLLASHPQGMPKSVLAEILGTDTYGLYYTVGSTRDTLEELAPDFPERPLTILDQGRAFILGL
jgi:hypothetical protein